MLKANRHIDQRGTITFFNDFDMSSVKRFYTIESKLGLVRAWQGHKVESKWFYAVKGVFRVKLLDFNSKEKVCDYILSHNSPKVLRIPKGVFNGFEAIEEGSILLVFSDARLEDSKKDDYRLSLDKCGW